MRIETALKHQNRLISQDRGSTMTLKKNSRAWAMAKRLQRRRGSLSMPIRLIDENTVEMAGILYGNTWTATTSELELLCKHYQLKVSR